MLEDWNSLIGLEEQITFRKGRIGMGIKKSKLFTFISSSPAGVISE